MTEHDRETWQQNDYDPKFIETGEGLRIARAFEEAGAEQIVAEHSAVGELLDAAKFLFSTMPLTDAQQAGQDRSTRWEATQALVTAVKNAEAKE